jgi:hypothetical protein
MPKWRVFNVDCGQANCMAPPFWVHMTSFPSILCQIVHKNLGSRLVPVPTLFKNIFHSFLQVFFFESHPVYDQTQGSGAVFSFLYLISK